MVRDWDLSYFGRMCNRLGECVEIPLYSRKIRGSGIYTDLPCVFGYFRIADYVYGIFGWKSKRKKYCGLVQKSLAERNEMAFVRMVRHGGKLSFDDVLYDGNRLDVCILFQNAARRFCWKIGGAYIGSVR